MEGALIKGLVEGVCKSKLAEIADAELSDVPLPLARAAGTIEGVRKRETAEIDGIELSDNSVVRTRAVGVTGARDAVTKPPAMLLLVPPTTSLLD